MYSDQGTIFVGANNDINRIYEFLQQNQERIVRCGTLENFTWHLNPAQSSHFGGLREAGIKSVKTHLSKILGDHPYTYEQHATLLAEISACSNSRPLGSETSDPNYLNPPTTDHFLVGGSIIAMSN